MHGAVVSTHASEEHAVAGPVRVEARCGAAKRDDADEGDGGEGRVDPRAAERGEAECQVGAGLGPARGSVEQEERGGEPEEVAWRTDVLACVPGGD